MDNYYDVLIATCQTSWFIPYHKHDQLVDLTGCISVVISEILTHMTTMMPFE